DRRAGGLHSAGAGAGGDVPGGFFEPVRLRGAGRLGPAPPPVGFLRRRAAQPFPRLRRAGFRRPFVLLMTPARGRGWGLPGGDAMTEEQWLASGDPGPMVAHLWSQRPATRQNARRLRLLGCACVRAVWPLLRHAGSRDAVVVAERYADGEATADDLWT